MSAALEGLVVLDMTAAFWASLATALLADFGGDVIRLDDFAEDAPSRCTGLDAVPPTALSWDCHDMLANRNKRSIAISFAKREGRAIVEELVRRCDVFLTDAPRPALAQRRLDYATLAALKPDLVYAQASGFGPQGPDRDLPPLDELAAARTGLMPVLPQPGEPPVYPGAGQMYSTVLLAFGVMTALWHRAETGEGQEVDASLLAGNMYGASLDLQAFLAIGGDRFLQPVSRLDAGNPMSGTLYPTSDERWVTLTMPDTDRWWPLLAPAVELDVNDARFDSHEKRCETNRLALIELLEQAFRRRPAGHWRAVIEELQLSADVIEDYAYPAFDEGARRNRYVIELERPNGETVKSLGFPVHLSDSPAELRRRTPRRGEQTGEVLGDLLGYRSGEIARLRSEGVVA